MKRYVLTILPVLYGAVKPRTVYNNEAEALRAVYSEMVSGVHLHETKTIELTDEETGKRIFLLEVTP